MRAASSAGAWLFVSFLWAFAGGCRTGLESINIFNAEDGSVASRDASGTENWRDSAIAQDGQVSQDGAMSDVSSRACPAELLAGSVAHYHFDDDPSVAAELRDALGAHPGSIVGGNITRIEGPTGCGTAWLFNGDSYVVLPASPDWQQREGSVDFWYRPTDQMNEGNVGILSRDAGGTGRPGHTQINQNTREQILLRIQSAGSETNIISPMSYTPGTWIHIGINYGPPSAEFYIDGTLVDTGIAEGLDGNENPWVIGAGSYMSNEGQATPVTDFLVGGAIDELRMSAQRRDFTR